jgi:D-3-phosphoglycerate dehydrogenase
MKVLVTDKIADEALKILEDADLFVTYDEMDHNKLLNEISKYDALMVRGRTKVVTEIINVGSDGNLKVIGRAGIGVDNVDIETAAKKGIPVVNAPTGATASVAELTISHMLALSRHISKADSSMKKGDWAKKQLKGNELYGKTLGLIGCGNIGILVSKFAQAFNMNVIGFDPFVNADRLKRDGIKKIEKLEELMKKSDYVSLHLPHTSKTHYIVNEHMLNNMKKTAFLINCARGGTVDEAALYKVLNEQKIAGAGLDVFEKEPPIKSPLLKLDNVVLTPHIGANTQEGQIRAGIVCAEQIIKVLKGKTPDFCVNKNLMK